VFRVERTFDLPREMDRRTWRRSEDRVPMRVTDFMTVEKHCPCLKVRTIIENTCKDHRFRVLFPTFAEADFSFADSPFAIVQRPIAIPPETAEWAERVNPEKPLTTFCGVQGEYGGFAVLAPFGPHEYAISQTHDRTLALTLFRSTFKTFTTPGELGGELLETMQWDYLLFPFAGQFNPVRAARLVAAAQTEVRAAHALDLPADHSFLEMEKNEVIVTALKPAADGAGGVIRLWNPDAEEIEETLRFGVPIASAALCNLNEEPASDVAVQSDNRVSVQVPARGLATLRFNWK